MRVYCCHWHRKGLGGKDGDAMVVLCGTKKVCGALLPNVKPLEDTEKGHNVGPIGDNGSGATEMKNGIILLSSNSTSALAMLGKGGRLELTGTSQTQKRLVLNLKSKLEKVT